MTTVAIVGGIRLTKSYFFSSNFDYDSFRKNVWSGPKEGERIELGGLKSCDGEVFPQVPHKSLILLAVVDPNCEMCRMSADLINNVEREAESRGLTFFVVSFASTAPKEEFFTYADSVFKAAHSYYWEDRQLDPLPSLKKMVVPSHLLIDENGVILRRFPGSSADRLIRAEMATQIIREITQEQESLNKG